MIDDKQMLKTLTEATDMALDSMRQILDKADNEALHSTLRAQDADYKQVHKTATELLAGCGESPKPANPVAKVNAHIATELKSLTADNLTSKLAEMTIQGSTMGITKVTKDLHAYRGDSGKIRSLAEGYIRSEQAHIENLKPFL